MEKPLPATLITLAAATVGGAVMTTLGAPVGWLSGAMTAVAILAMAGGPAHVPVPVRETSFLALGITAGTGITPATVAGVATWPVSLAILFLTIPLIVGSAMAFLVLVCGWNRRDALLGAIPGALSFVVATATSEGADVRRIAVVQSIRLFALGTAFPFLFTGMAGSGGAAVAPLPVTALGIVLALMAISAAAGVVLRWIDWPAPLMFAGLFVSGAAHGSGMVEGQLPGWLAIPAIVVLGANSGARFAGTDVWTLLRLLAAAMGALAVGLAVTALTALVAVWATGLPLALVFLGFVPGSLEAMLVIAFSLELDPAFVAAHQLLRFLAIALALPLVFRRIFPRDHPGP